jgi:hypothetical protein
MAAQAQESRLTDLFEAARTAADSGRGLPPVQSWNPPHCGDIDIRIAGDGAWFHEGAPISRPALVRLFSTVLRKDDDGFCLVTPAEKLRIQVDDAPFVAVGLEDVEAAVRFVTNVGDIVEAGPEHPIRVETAADGQPRPYVRVRGDLDALIARAVFYELVALGEPRDGRLGISSGGCWFDLGALDA